MILLFLGITFLVIKLVFIFFILIYFYPLTNNRRREPPISVELSANLTGGDYIWKWNTKVCDRQNLASPRLNFRQSTFFGSPVALDHLRCRAANYIPPPGKNADSDAYILTIINGKNSLGEIATMAMNQFPEHFPRWEVALSRAGELAEKYSR